MCDTIGGLDAMNAPPSTDSGIGHAADDTNERHRRR